MIVLYCKASCCRNVMELLICLYFARFCSKSSTKSAVYCSGGFEFSSLCLKEAYAILIALKNTWFGIDSQKVSTSYAHKLNGGFHSCFFHTDVDFIIKSCPNLSYQIRINTLGEVWSIVSFHEKVSNSLLSSIYCFSIHFRISCKVIRDHFITL